MGGRASGGRRTSGGRTTRGRGKKKQGSRANETVGIILLLLGLVLLLSLLSYNPTDPPAFDSAAEVPRNWMGRLGALLAYGMVGKLGRIPPILTIVVILLWGWRLLRNSVDRSLVTTSLKIFGIQALLSIVLAFPHFLINETISYDLAGEWGGMVAGFLVTNVGIGAPLVWLVLVILFLMAAYGIKPGEIAGAAVSAGRAAGSGASALWGVIRRIATALSNLVASIISKVGGGKTARAGAGADEVAATAAATGAGSAAGGRGYRR